MSNRPLRDEILFQETTIVGNGEVYNVDVEASTLALSVSGSSTDAVLNFEAKNRDDDDWTLINALNYETLDLSTSIILTPGLYQIDLTGLKYIRCRISDITNGDVLIVGRVVD